MKTPLHLLFSLLLVVSLSGTKAQNFTWIKGTGNTAQTGLYGTLGTPGIGNNPGSREGAVSWKDASGNYWMFGGFGYDFIGNNGSLNDLWKYNPVTNEWTWIKGDNVATQAGVYGTQGVGANLNKPGSRDGAVSWQDAAGNVWLFGGWGYGSAGGLGYLNDLWKYNPVNNQWTWVSGSNLPYQPASYGTPGVSSPSNVPGARRGAVSWADANGNLWLHGGLGNTTTSMTVGYLDDLWKYNIANNEWTWMKGNNVADQNGAYGTQGTSAPTNNPGSRMLAVSWTDASGDFWMLGGSGYDASSTSVDFLNDLWKYSLTTNEWVWMKGSNSANKNGVYGTPGVSSPSNTPGSRINGVTWVDGINNLWIFGGNGYDINSTTAGYLSDLWKYSPATNEWMFVKGSGTFNFPGVYGTVGTPSVTNIPGARRGGVSWIDQANNLWMFGGYGKPASGNPGALNDLWKYNNCFISPITLTITAKDTLICAGETTSLTVTGGSNYLWNTGGTFSYLQITPNVTTTYTASTTNSNGCVYSVSHTQSVSACIFLPDGSEKAAYALAPNPGNGSFTLRSNQSGGRISILNTLGQLVFAEELGQLSENVIHTALPKGMYYVRVEKQSTLQFSTKLLIE